MNRHIKSAAAKASVSVTMLFTLAGCHPTAEFVPVSGRVEVDGIPLTTGAIIVVPEAGRPAAGKISSDGRFTLSTLSPGDGIVRGTHRVVVNAFRDDGQSRQWLVPAACREIPTTPLRINVDGPNADAVVRIDTGGQSLEVEAVVSEAGDDGGT